MAFGFRPVRNIDGTAWNGATVRCAIPTADANVLAIGDLVILLAGGGVLATSTAGEDGAPGTYYPTVGLAATSGFIFGAITSFEPLRSDLSAVARAASTLRHCNVAVATPSLVFECTADMVGTNTTVVDIGANFDHLATATTTNYSVMALDSSTIDTSTAVRGFKLIGFANDPGNLADIGSVVAGRLTTSSVCEVVCLETQIAVSALAAAV